MTLEHRRDGSKMRQLVLATIVLLLSGCGGGGGDGAGETPPPSSPPPAPAPPSRAPAETRPPNAPGQTPAFPGQTRAPQPATTETWRAETVAVGLEYPWAIEFLDDGRMLVSERPGRLRVLAADGRLSGPLSGLPAVDARGQGGLLDVALAPDFATSRRLYWSYAEPRGEDRNATAVATGVLTGQDTALADVRVVFRQEPPRRTGLHFGSRLVFDRQGRLFITTGDRGDAADLAQDVSIHIGKVIRINADGSAPADNPFTGRVTARAEVWSYGHRNIQAAALHPGTGELWTVEHGARGGDELNRPLAGRNYGWPVISYGLDYSGGPIGQGLTAREGMEQPLYYWDPVIAPSGMEFYTGHRFPAWGGSLFIGALSLQGLVRLTLADERVTSEERLDLGARIRDVKQGPDGAIYVVTDEPNGRVLRIVPRVA